MYLEDKGIHGINSFKKIFLNSTNWPCASMVGHRLSHPKNLVTVSIWYQALQNWSGWKDFNSGSKMVDNDYKDIHYFI